MLSPISQYNCQKKTPVHSQKEVAINARFGIYCAQQASQSGHNLKRFLHRTRKSTSNLVPIFVSSAPLNALKNSEQRYRARHHTACQGAASTLSVP